MNCTVLLDCWDDYSWWWCHRWYKPYPRLSKWRWL